MAFGCSRAGRTFFVLTPVGLVGARRGMGEFKSIANVGLCVCVWQKKFSLPRAGCTLALNRDHHLCVCLSSSLEANRGRPLAAVALASSVMSQGSLKSHAHDQLAANPAGARGCILYSRVFSISSIFCSSLQPLSMHVERRKKRFR